MLQRITGQLAPILSRDFRVILALSGMLSDLKIERRFYLLVNCKFCSNFEFLCQVSVFVI